MTFISGRVLVRAEGKGLERFLNKLTRSKVMVWKVKRQKEEAMLFYVFLRDIHTIRRLVKEQDCTLTFIRGEGFPFLWRRTIRNAGFLIGIFLFLFVITFLSNVTWGIIVKGATPETEHKIRKELDKLGVRVGTLHLLGDDPETLQRKLTDRVENITWVGVELKGTTYHFQVVEKTEPKSTEQTGPQHLVAKKKAVIADLFIEKGKPLIKVHQFVEKGQLLVSGEIGKEDEPEIVAAKGKVWGKTWYVTKVEFPLESVFQTYTGNEIRKHMLKVSSLSIPFWGFSKHEFQEFEEETDERSVQFLGWRLPVQYVERAIREKKEVTRSLTKEEAVEAAMELARRDVKKTMPDDAEVDDEYILHESVENGKVLLSVYFQVIENIAEGKPIIQGD